MILRPTAAVLALLLATAPAFAKPLVTPFKQAVAQAAAEDESIAAFYRARDFAPIWMGEGAEHRRAAFLWALDAAHDHGLPEGRYDAATIRAEFAAAATGSERGLLEVEMTRRFLRYAQDVSSGVLDPRQVDRGIVVDLPRRDWLEQITAFTEGDPYAFVQGLWPRSCGWRRRAPPAAGATRCRAAGSNPATRARRSSRCATG